MKKKLVVVVGIVLYFVIAASSGLGQETRSDLKDRKISIKTEGQSVKVVFHYLMANCGLQIGFEESILDKEHTDYEFVTNPGLSKVITNSDGSIFIDPNTERLLGPHLHPITLNFIDATVARVLDAIVEQMQNYKWEINDGVVNIYPSKGRDDKFRKLLDLNIQRFYLEKGSTVMDVTKAIMTLPEFRRFVFENKLEFTGARGGAVFVIKGRYGRIIAETLDFSNLTLREILNRISTVKKGGWLLRHLAESATEGRAYIDIDI